MPTLPTEVGHYLSYRRNTLTSNHLKSYALQVLQTLKWSAAGSNAPQPEQVGGGGKCLYPARLMQEEIAERLSALTSQLDHLLATTTEGEG